MATNLFQTDFPPAEFTARRARVYDAIGPEAHALVAGAAPVCGFGAFRQTNEFYHLCGVEAPQAYLWLEGRARRATLFLPPRAETAGCEGETLGSQDVELIREHTGLDDVQPLAALGSRLNHSVRTLYLPMAPPEGAMTTRGEALAGERAVEADPWDGQLPRRAHLQSLIAARRPGLAFADLSPLLDELRGVKSANEIALLRRAGGLSAEVVTAAMKVCRPGLLEYQFGALAQRIYLDAGARGPAYRQIIASGPNVWYGHYFRNDAVLADGTWVLMDTAPDYRYYTSDIGRMFPVNGVWSPVQRELYGLVIEYHKALLARIRPGVLAADIHADAAAAMAPVIDRWSFSKEIYAAAARRMLEFTGHLSHAVGMAVHDHDNYRPRPLGPGVVFAVDPQMWIPEEQLYVRCEDTIVVTEDGIENFTAAAPLELDEVEAVMRG
jgi:Xaa-Pro aminopeptidase